jgi:hypothetical protein
MAEMSPSPRGSDPRDRVERTYYADGKLEKEIHYRGITEHGSWRTWHPNGVLAEEYWFEIGAYMNGTNRSWHANGQLHTEQTYKNGAPVSPLRIFNEDGTELLYEELLGKAHAKKRTKRKAAEVEPDAVEQHRRFVADLLRGPNAEAREWLRGGHPNSRNLGDMEPAESLAWVERLYELGAAEVMAVEIETFPGRDEAMTNHVLARLPADPKVRQQLFDFENACADSEGFSGERDVGQEYVYFKLG